MVVAFSLLQTAHHHESSMAPATPRGKLTALIGESTSRMARSCRLNRAFQLLDAEFDNITEGSLVVEFSSIVYFKKDNSLVPDFHQKIAI